MSSVALAGRLHSAQSEDCCSDLNQVVARVEQSIARVAGHYVGVQFSLSPNVALVAVAPAELERAVLGLCAGACSMLSPGGRLVVETRGMSDAPVGAASAPAAVTEARARVVIRTEQLGHPAQRDLTHAYSEVAIADLEDLLRRVGGELELVQLADSDLAFVAHLPYALASNSSGRMAIAVAQGVGAILLVEDEPQVQAVTARILRAFGYSVVTAHNERTALAQAEQHGSAIGLVVSDLVLPGVSGKDLVRRLRKPCEHAQILYISGYSPDHVGALADGARFLRKPFTAQELLAIVRELLPVIAG